MLMFLANNWKWIVAALMAAALTGLVAWGLHSWDVSLINARHNKHIAKLEKKLNNDCLAAKLVPYEVSDVYQKNLSVFDRQLDDYLLRIKFSPDAVSAGNTTSGRDAGRSQSAVVSRPRCADPRAILELARDADKERAKRRALQDYIRRGLKTFISK